MKTSANKKLSNGHYIYNGYEIELVSGNWLMKPVGESEWTDAENTLRFAKDMIDIYNSNERNAQLAKI